MVIGGAAGVWLVCLVVGTLLIVGIVRFASGKERASDPDAHGDGAASGMFGELVEIFQPSRVHLVQERDRQRMDIAQRPAEGLPFGIDLEGGVAYLDAGSPPSGGTEPTANRSA